ncbi:MAG: biotin--[acetyl-CoA-carboxylase] ligase [Melioribacteraceae bacterium]|nr:biotin--[acetyl-CoA-carboxylase] ligase [Melioribacteraceae bacterium]MCF8263639.1 biotin--[acetyl-CoA-carboxylase] ligase [Melioribacteraceae bacterium]MCF8412054.1 biotin--[acetyl-CoA-carboxylase] ligase [Melioribacteraceae bacterium]MCF8431893.1 biotin--[acetyl-CoA-carboxylase] ligase [Melioribacteraceae bacterium]
MLTIEDFDIKLETETFGRNFVVCDEVDSTNRFLLDSKEFDEHGTVVFAEFQTKGRGRKDREWVSQKGLNLTFSILITKKLKKINVNLIHFAASLSVAQALENLFQLNINLKWPNDVLVGEKKIAGILLESISKGEKINRLVVGIGINVNQPTFSGKFNIQPTSTKIELKRIVSRERLLSEILNILESNYRTLRKDPLKIMNDWRARCKMIGEKIRIVDENIDKYGILEDIDNEGYVLLKTNGKVEKINYGDISLR